MKRFFSSLALFAFFAAAAFAVQGVSGVAAQAQGLSGTIATSEQEAEALEAEENWAGLEQLAGDWVREDQKNWKAWYYYGLAKNKLGKVDEAVDIFIVMRRLAKRDDEEILLLITDNYSVASRWEKAEKGYRLLLDKYPNNPMLWDKMRDLKERQLSAQPDAAAKLEREISEILVKLLQFEPYVNDINLWQRRADLMLAMENLADVRVSYGQILRLDSKNTYVLEWIFSYDMEHGDEKTWKRTLANMETVAPDSTLLHLYKGQQAMARRNAREARYHYEIVTRDANRPKQQAQAFAGLGDLEGSGKTNKAFSNYRQALLLDPTLIEVWESLVVILRAQKQHSQARKYLSGLQLVESALKKGQPVPPEALDVLHSQ